jgi:hypothetical protein
MNDFQTNLSWKFSQSQTFSSYDLYFNILLSLIICYIERFWDATPSSKINKPKHRGERSVVTQYMYISYVIVVYRLVVHIVKANNYITDMKIWNKEYKTDLWNYFMSNIHTSEERQILSHRELQWLIIST